MFSEVLRECKRQSGEYHHHKQVAEPVTLAKHLTASPRRQYDRIPEHNSCFSMYYISFHIQTGFISHLKAVRKKEYLSFLTSIKDLWLPFCYLSMKTDIEIRCNTKLAGTACEAMPLAQKHKMSNTINYTGTTFILCWFWLTPHEVEIKIRILSAYVLIPVSARSTFWCTLLRFRCTLLTFR